MIEGANRNRVRRRHGLPDDVRHRNPRTNLAQALPGKRRLRLVRAGLDRHRDRPPRAVRLQTVHRFNAVRQERADAGRIRRPVRVGHPAEGQRARSLDLARQNVLRLAFLAAHRIRFERQPSVGRQRHRLRFDRLRFRRRELRLPLHVADGDRARVGNALPGERRPFSAVNRNHDRLMARHQAAHLLSGDRERTRLPTQSRDDRRRPVEGQSAPSGHLCRQSRQGLQDEVLRPCRRPLLVRPAFASERERHGLGIAGVLRLLGRRGPGHLRQAHAGRLGAGPLPDERRLRRAIVRDDRDGVPEPDSVCRNKFGHRDAVRRKRAGRRLGGQSLAFGRPGERKRPGTDDRRRQGIERLARLRPFLRVGERLPDIGGEGHGLGVGQRRGRHGPNGVKGAEPAGGGSRHDRAVRKGDLVRRRSRRVRPAEERRTIAHKGILPQCGRLAWRKVLRGHGARSSVRMEIDA